MKKKSKKKQRPPTKAEQRTAANILTMIYTAQDNSSVEGLYATFREIEKLYNLEDDPFTGLPCTPEEYYENKREYERQIMMERYGHCDGLD